MELDFPISVFDFVTNEKGEYVNVFEERENKWHSYSYEEIVKGYELNNDFVICATFHTNPLSQYGLSLEEVRQEILKEAKSKTYHYGNLRLDYYVYSFKYANDGWWVVLENPNHLVLIRHTGNIDDLLFGKEKMCYPACEVTLFEQTDTGLKKIMSGYGEYKSDIRYTVLCEEFKILEFSTNRIDPNKKPTDFYEAEHTLEDFMKYWGEENENQKN